MPQRPEDSVEAADFDLPDDDELESGETRLLGTRSGLGRGGPPSSAAGSGGVSRSPYELPRSEQLKGVANRIIFSRYYILFYFVMMSLSLTTVVLSLLHHNKCLPTSWHIIEVIVNAMMVLEVGTRWTAYGKKYPLTPLNVIDLLLVCFCVITLIVVFNSGCTDGSRSEENLDLVLLVVRNAVQFARLVNILRRSGHSLLSPPKPIDLSHARTASLAMDLDLDLSDDEAVAERQLSAPSSRRTLAGSAGGGAGSYEPIFTDEDPELAQELQSSSRRSLQGVRKPLDVSASQGRQNLSQEDEDMWDRLG